MPTAPQPPYRVDHVGSLCRPQALLTAFDGFEDGTLSPEEFKRIADSQIRDAVALQEKAGLKAVTDGEFRRRSYSRSIFLAVEGLDQRPGPFKFRNAEGKSAAVNAGYAKQRLRRRHAIVADDVAYVKSVTTAVPKATMLAPSYFHFGLFSQSADKTAYPDIEEYLQDLAQIYIDEMRDLAAIGCTYLQLDEVPLAMLCDSENQSSVRAAGEDPKRLIDRYIELNNAICRARPPGMKIAMHFCRGNREGMWAAAGGYEPIAEKMFNQLEVDAYLLEFDSSRAGGFAPLRFLPENKIALLGLVSTKNPQVESADDLKRKLDEAARHAPLERLGLCPQCGFAASALRKTANLNPMTQAIQVAKLNRIMEVAHDAWGEGE
ncbi:MAG: 5-methyltetrahydropteroyltriglutamate--homocysteine S-methyltransferase [Burkholderiales bacterium]